jgi:hypothetical protein
LVWSVMAGTSLKATTGVPELVRGTSDAPASGAPGGGGSGSLLQRQ